MSRFTKPFNPITTAAGAITGGIYGAFSDNHSVLGGASLGAGIGAAAGYGMFKLNKNIIKSASNQTIIPHAQPDDLFSKIASTPNIMHDTVQSAKAAAAHMKNASSSAEAYMKASGSIQDSLNNISSHYDDLKAKIMKRRQRT